MKQLFKPLLILFFVFYSTSTVLAQAFDWSKTDCNNKTWHLFDYLDSNQVVVMEFGMGCSSCTDAAGFFSNLKNQYAISYPGRLKTFYMDFWGNTCGVNMASTGMDAQFDSCSAELSAYCSASPMTFIVIAAGPSHSLIYSFDKKFIFDFSDTVAIKSAIKNYLDGVGIKEVRKEKDIVSIYPNPVRDKIYFTHNSVEKFSFTLYDVRGCAVKEGSIDGKDSYLTIETIPAGEYFLNLKFNSGRTETKKLLKIN